MLTGISSTLNIVEEKVSEPANIEIETIQKIYKTLCGKQNNVS